MTREEFVHKDSWILAVIRDRCELTRAEKDYLNILIEVLEQEPKTDILDKIRAEIEKWRKEGTNWSDIRLMKIEDILDKYKAESEG